MSLPKHSIVSVTFLCTRSNAPSSCHYFYHHLKEVGPFYVTVPRYQPEPNSPGSQKSCLRNTETTRASSRLRSTVVASSGVTPPDPMEASTSTTTPLPPALKSNAVRMTADRTANTNELHAHTNPLNVTFAERAEAVFLAQEHNLKETPTPPIPSAELLTPLNPSSPYFAPSQTCSSSTQVPATQYPNILPQTSPNQSLIQEMLAALQPALDAVALKFELGLKELKADLLGEIVILRDHITA
jgi:hypothetical protein